MYCQRCVERHCFFHRVRVTNAYGRSNVGYDVCAALKTFLKRKGYAALSVAEVILGLDHPDAGRAEAFMSHAQKETIEVMP